MAYSASDYQHGKAAVAPSQLPPVPAIRSKSQYSILNNEHLHSLQSFDEPPPSDASYDPFRASRDPVIKASRQYMNVTVHRGASNGSRLRPPSVQHSARQSSGPLRVEALKRESRASSRRLGSSVSLKKASSHRLSSTRRLASKSSLGSSVWASSPPVAAVRPNTLHKRGVNFSHLRRSSTASALTARTREEQGNDTAADRKQSLKRKLQDTDISLPVLPSSPVTKPQVAIRGRKETTTEQPARLRLRKAQDPRQIVDHEARKISAELEKVCQEAFFRSSITTARSSTSTNKSLSVVDTAPSSVTQQSPVLGRKPDVTTTTMANRPLPPLPPPKVTPKQPAEETPKTYTARELAETRNRIAARFAEANGDNADYFGDVLAHLDSLLPNAPVSGMRARSAPEPMSRLAEDLGYLPAIFEEDKYADAEEPTLVNEPSSNWKARASTGRGGLRTGTSQSDPMHDSHTIRVVDHSSPCPIAPLNIRKVSDASTEKQAAPPPASNYDKIGTVVRRPGRNAGRNFAIHEDEAQKLQPSSPTVPAIIMTGPEDEAPKSKMRGWLKRITSSGSDEPVGEATKMKSSKQRSPILWQELDDRIRANPFQAFGHKQQPSQATVSDVSEFPMRSNESDKLEPTPKDEEGVKKGLWNLFRKRKGKKTMEDKIDRGLRIGCKSPSPSVLNAFGIRTINTDVCD